MIGELFMYIRSTYGRSNCPIFSHLWASGSVKVCVDYEIIGV